MPILRCCVIDDEPLAAQLIESYIERTPFLELAGSFSSAQDAVRTVLSGEIDLLFLDIHMPQLNGLEFARVVPPECAVIFTTAYKKYAVDGFRVNAVDYLLKPVDYEEFLRSARKAMRVVYGRSRGQIHGGDDCVIVKSEYKLVQIALDDILYVEGMKDYLKFCLVDGRSVMTLMSIRLVEAALPASRFMRVHRSFIVNLSKINTIERNRIVFGNTYIPVSETYKQSFADYVSARILGAPRGDMPEGEV